MFKICFPIWYAVSYADGNDVGEAVVTLLGAVVPLLLVVAALVLATLTGLGRVLVRERPQSLIRYTARTVLIVARILVASLALMFFLFSATFFMGEETALTRHWEVSVAWVLVVICAMAFLIQQWRRVRVLWIPSASLKAAREQAAWLAGQADALTDGTARQVLAHNAGSDDELPLSVGARAFHAWNAITGYSASVTSELIKTGGQWLSDGATDPRYLWTGAKPTTAARLRWQAQNANVSMPNAELLNSGGANAIIASRGAFLDITGSRVSVASGNAIQASNAATVIANNCNITATARCADVLAAATVALEGSTLNTTTMTPVIRVQRGARAYSRSNTFVNPSTPHYSQTPNVLNERGLISVPDYIARNGGTATIMSGDSSVAVAHGLSAAPTLSEIRVAPLGDLGAASKFYISGANASTFNIVVDTAVSANLQFGWEASKRWWSIFNCLDRISGMSQIRTIR